MNGEDYAKDYIMLKQRSWAKRNVKRDDFVKNYPDYLRNYDLNLFEPLSEINTKSFLEGRGKELQDDGETPAKMKAIQSSAALAVNLFQYWQREDGKHIPALLNALMPAGLLPEASNAQAFSSIEFEKEFKIVGNWFGPHLDAVLHGSEYDIAVESKFIEPYRDEPGEFEKAYIEKAYLWEGIPALYELAKEISADNNKFRRLDAKQLITHILGLKKNAGSRGFCLLYLWYDVFGEKGKQHREEIEQFAAIAKADGIQFGHTTYQEVISSLVEECYEGNEAYCDYLVDRYL